MLFKKKNKKSIISIENTCDDINISVDWDKDNIDQINLFIKIIVMLNNGDLKEHIEKAILHSGKINGDEETADQIVTTIRNINDNVVTKYSESKYISNAMKNKRNPVVSPDQVINLFKNSINS